MIAAVQHLPERDVWGMARSVRVLSVLSLYVGIVAVRWWPLPLHLGDQLPYIPEFECDRLYSTWALAWSSHALATDPARLADANIYFPARDALFYGPTGFGALVLFAPAYLLSGRPIVAINITFLAGIASTACLLHLVVFVRTWLAWSPRPRCSPTPGSRGRSSRPHRLLPSSPTGR